MALTKASYSMIDGAQANVLDYGAIGDGTTDDTSAIQAAINSGNPVFIPSGTFLTGPLTATNATIFGHGTLKGSAAVASAALLTTTNTKVKDITIDSGTSTLYGILAGDYSDISGVTFIGDFGHCVIVSGAEFASVKRCVVKEGGSHTTAFVISDSQNTLVAENLIEEHTGFGIQARWSDFTTISNNVIKQRYYQQGFTASSTTETFTITTGRSCSRFSAFSNGAFRNVSGTTTVTSTSYQVTVTGLTIGQSVTVYAFVGLESIQANSGCNGVTIEGNSVFHSGDSCIVIGADYHWTGSIWDLDPPSVVESDYPRNVTISNNNLTGPALAAGVALNNASYTSVIGNIISDIGYDDDDAYRAGVSCAYILDCVIRDNITDGRNTHTEACVKYTGNTTGDYGDDNASNTFGFNKGISCPNFAFFPDSSSTLRRVGYNIVDAKVDDLITRAVETMLDSGWTSGAYSDNYIAVTISGGTGIANSTTYTHSYWTSIKTFAGEHGDITIDSAVENIFANRMCRVSFFGRVGSSGDEGYVSLFYDTTTDDAEPRHTETIDSTTWTEYSFVMAIGAIDSLKVRVGGTTNNAYVSRLRIDVLDVE